MRPQHPHSARGFTLIEVSLAVVLSALVLAGCMSVFLALSNAEDAFDQRYHRTSELDIAHTSFTRAMLSLQMQETTGTTIVRADSEEATEQSSEDEVTRGRLILEYDYTVEPDSTGWIPQRLEVVCSTPPVPSGLASQAAEWYTAESRDESLDFSALDGSQGITRGVFELRRSGERERIMQRLGLIAANDSMLSDVELDQQLDLNAPPDWTLWWRPILTDEAEQLNAGYGPLPDTEGDPEAIRARLAGAVPLLRHIDRCIWELYKGDEFIDAHIGLEMSDLPAYAQFEVILTNQQYASWMFEIDWITGDDPLTVASASTDSADDTDADGSGDPPSGGNGTGTGTGNTNGGGTGGRPGGSDPGTDNRFNFDD
ncbi:MAG: hypothetical protein CMJ35_14860 [Phycisphaerae bacterium]|nr:hypothetical protein [Phycisphaerae bacterium]MBM92422.1 hypothetical protein [Phycisphaerae bacterium]MBM92868.1 hypothetical protein [Phycisphaerae bacterium]HCT43688.1 hypothetical protein [Phycisphaerales bacterium]